MYPCSGGISGSEAIYESNACNGLIIGQVRMSVASDDVSGK